MFRHALLALSCLAASLPTSVGATITATFTNRNAFVAAVGPITSHSIGLPGTAPVFATILVTGPITVSARDDQLAGDGGGIVSTNLDADELILAFDTPVFAVGLVGGIGDVDFHFFTGATDVTAVGSGSSVFSNSGSARYFGLISDIAFSQLRLGVHSFDADTSIVAYVALKDHIDLVGSTGVPDVATWATMMLGFGTLGIVTRWRRAPARSAA